MGIICREHLNLVQVMAGHIVLGRISKKMALLFQDTDQVILILACIAITIFAPNKLKRPKPP